MRDDPESGVVETTEILTTPVAEDRPLDEQEEMMIPLSDQREDSATKKRANRKTSRPGTIQMKSSSSTPGKGGTRKKSTENARAVFIKYFALFLLVAQMVGLVLLMRYSRINHKADQPLYLASTAVFNMEIMKLFICLIVIAYQTGGALLPELHLHVIQSPMEIVRLTIPSLLYTIQNNLLYLALTNLDAATYQVCYQLKILTTALFSALLLQRKFSGQKWASLVILTVGVAIVQVSGSGDQHNHHLHALAHHNHREASETDPDNNRAQQHNRIVGLVAVLCAACTSGFSGVYFEKILKGSRTSLWIRNVQMGLPSIIIAYLTIYFKDATAVRSQGFFGGYNSIVWTVVTVQAVGGLIVATVVKYADNVLKVFATSFSIVISCVISAFLFDFQPTWMFLSGASLVITATVMYSSPEATGNEKNTMLRKIKKKISTTTSVLPITSPGNSTN